MPAISREVPKVGLDPPFRPSDTEGELMTVSGNETVHTQSIWPIYRLAFRQNQYIIYPPIQNPKNLKK